MQPQQTKHPTDQTDLPSYVRPTLKDLAEDLKRANDAWNYLRGAKAKYLPKEEGEPQPAYDARLNRAVYSGFYRDSIEAFAGILSRFELRDPPESFAALWSNIDNEGNDGKSFLMVADGMMLRDGGICLGVEMPPGQAGSRAEELTAGRRPYLVARARSRMLNWRTAFVGGREVATRCTFLEMVELEDGEYGVKHEPRYRVIEPGQWTVYRIKEVSGSGKLVAEVDVDDDGNPKMGEYLMPGGQPLPVVPLVWYSADGEGWGTGGLPLRGVLEHDLEHFRCRSDLEEKRHRVSMPVPVRTGEPPVAPGQMPPPLVLGPNTVVDVPLGGSFAFAEPSASSLADQQKGIEHIEGLIREKTANFAYGEGSPAKTATQAGLEAAHAQAGISKLAARKQSALQELMAIWCLFTGEQLSDDAGINMSATIYDRPLGPQERAQVIAEVDAGILSKATAIEILQRGGANPVTQSPEEELERIREDQAEMASMIGVNDPEAVEPEQMVAGGA